jgi:hypothetical protein
VVRVYARFFVSLLKVDPLELPVAVRISRLA